MMNWLILIGLGILLVVVAFVLYFDILKDKTPSLKTLRKAHFLYIESQAEYKNISGVWQRLFDDVSSMFEDDDVEYAGVYFDNPNNVREKHLCRAAVGARIFDEQTLAKAQEFASRAPNYKLIELPEVKSQIHSKPPKSIF